MDIESCNNEKMSDEHSHGYFPLEYFIDFLKFLKNNDDIIEIITYDDLPWGDDYDYERNYPQEYKNWKDQLNKGERDKRKIYVLLQHDVDSAPERTMTVLREEERLGIPSNVMIFNQRINRRYLQRTGELMYTDYELDYKYLRKIQDESGFVIGYHSNAFDQALFNMGKAMNIFEDDVKELQKNFTIKFFSPHGGARSPEGLSNNILTIPDSLKSSLRWVHNRKKVRFDGEYSDGGINSPKRNPADRDLRDYVKKWQRGKRYRILIHPQYYNTPYKPSPRMRGTRWYDELLDFYSSRKPGSAWDGVKLDDEDRTLRERMSQTIFSIKNMIRRNYVRK